MRTYIESQWHFNWLIRSYHLTAIEKYLHTHTQSKQTDFVKTDTVKADIVMKRSVYIHAYVVHE